MKRANEAGPVSILTLMAEKAVAGGILAMLEGGTAVGELGLATPCVIRGDVGYIMGCGVGRKHREQD